MKPILIVSLLVIPLNSLFIYALSDQSQSCITDLQIPFTGYKVEYQLHLRELSGSYHLLYCNDNKLINDIWLNDSIPWTKPIPFYTKDAIGNSLILARQRAFALRTVPIFLPNTLVGAMYYVDAAKIKQKSALSKESILLSLSNNGFKSMPLLAANILHNWCEVNYRFQFIYHIPILTTPTLDSRRYNHRALDGDERSDWNKYISILESYGLSKDSLVSVKCDFDLVENTMNSITAGCKSFIDKFRYKEVVRRDISQLWWKFILISKTIGLKMSKKMILKIEKLLRQAENVESSAAY